MRKLTVSIIAAVLIFSGLTYGAVYAIKQAQAVTTLDEENLTTDPATEDGQLNVSVPNQETSKGEQPTTPSTSTGDQSEIAATTKIDEEQPAVAATTELSEESTTQSSAESKDEIKPVATKTQQIANTTETPQTPPAENKSASAKAETNVAPAKTEKTAEVQPAPTVVEPVAPATSDWDDYYADDEEFCDIDEEDC